jgi:hypothetical protein
MAPDIGEGAAKLTDDVSAEEIGRAETSAFGAGSLLALLGHRYDQLELIDGRSTSLVYRARQISTGRTVAIKLMLDRRSRPGADLPTESRALAKLSWHSHVLSLIETDVTADGIPVLVTEFADGGSVETLAGRGALTIDAALAILTQVASAMVAAHRLGIVHCDLKPANILLAADGTARLSDFGIARMLDVTAPTLDDIRGTLRYVAPEVLEGAPPTFAADVYGLAVTAWTMLEGEPADSPSGDLLSAVASQMQRGPLRFDRLRLRRPGSDRVAGVLERAAADDPSERPSMEELAEALAAVRVGAPPPPSTPSTTGPHGRPPSWRRVAAVGALIALIGGLAFSLGTERGTAAEEPVRGSVTAFCRAWTTSSARQFQLIDGLADQIEAAPTAYDAARIAVVSAPRRFADVAAPAIDAARDLPTIRDAALQLSPDAIEDIVLADGIYALTRLRFLISPGTEVDRDQIPLAVRGPTLAWDSLLRFSSDRCGPPPDGATARLRSAKSAIGLALRHRLDKAGLAEFFADDRSYDLFDEQSMLMMLELAPGYVDQMFPEHSQWFATLGERRPNLRRIVFAQAPEMILLIASEAPSFEQTLVRVHPEWIADLQTQLGDLEVSERRRIAASYSELLDRLGLQLSTSPEGG